MSEKPLHVRVAGALGCRAVPSKYVDGAWCCECDPTEPHAEQEYGGVMRYDLDWSATGPLIERYQITVWNDRGQWQAGLLDSAPHEGWWLNRSEDGATPLIAVCNRILAMKESGELEAGA